MIKTVSFLLISLFAADYVSMYLSIHPVVFARSVQKAEDQCGCTCCGDVCSMGAACCCNEKEKEDERNYSGIRIVQTDCRPNMQPFVLNSIFSRGGVWITTTVSALHEPEAGLHQQFAYHFAVLSHDAAPPTPPPQA